jgi:hypothetical protein
MLWDWAINTLFSCFSPLITLILVCICLHHLCCNLGLSRTISAYGVSCPTYSLFPHGYIERCARYCLFGYVQDIGFVYTETSCLYFGLSFLVESNASIMYTETSCLYFALLCLSTYNTYSCVYLPLSFMLQPWTVKNDLSIWCIISDLFVIFTWLHRKVC